MSKYEPLTVHLRKSGIASVPITFDKIERIVGVKLPPSAFKYRAWWSNNPTNSVITHAWLEAGYKTANVDMAGRKLVFRKYAKSESAPESVDEREAPNGADAGYFSRIYGALQGTVTIHKDTDLTSPVDAEWDAER
ncbi:MAG: hypothetical protein OXE44_02965 [Nitrospinae bacterium]|nr:hypothetical protein [Nitrospinota bacterium]